MKVKRIISVVLLSLIICLLYTVRVDAASVSLSASSTSVTVGTKVTITVNGTAATWDLEVSGSGISTTKIVGNTSDAENGNFSKSVSFTPSSAGTYTFKLTGNMMDESAEDYDNDIITVNKSVTITAKAKTSSSSSGGSSSQGGSSGRGSSSSSSNSSSNNTTPKAPSFSSVNENVYATDSVNVRSSYSTSSSVIGSLEKGDSVTRTGRATSAVNGITWSRVTYNGQTAYISSAYLTTEKPEESTNKDLKELTIEGDYTLTPEFSKDVTEYDLTVGEDVESIKVNAVANDDAAKVEVTGNDSLLMGLNTVEIKVTAEDGTEKTYKINVTRGKVDPLGLSELTIEGYTLAPEFNSEVYEYTLDIPDLSVTSLNINAISNMENATVEITGEDNLIQGENVITILVKSEDGENTATYQITANIHEPEKTQLIAGIDDKDLFLYGGIALGVIIVITIIIVVVRHNRKKDDDFGTYYGGFDSLNRDVKNDDNKFGEDDKIDYKTNINPKNEKEADLNSDATTSLNENLDTNVSNTNGLDFSNNLESDVDDEAKSHRKSVIEENFGADINMNRFDDVPPKRRKGKHF